MPTRRTLLGVPSGTPVNLSLLQAGASASGQTDVGGWGAALIPPPPPPVGQESLTVSISTLSPTDTHAPAGYTFVADVAQTVNRVPASGTYSPDADLNFLLAEIYWETDDTSDSFQAPRNTAVAGHLRKDRGIGEHFCKVFDTPGTHTVTCFVYFPDGRFGTASTTVTVGAPDAGYSAQETIVVSGTGNFAGAPAHDAANACTTLDDAFARLAELGGTQARILFDPVQGIDFTGSEPGYSVNHPSIRTLRIGSWTYGTKGTWTIPSNGGRTLFSISNGDETVFKLVDIHIASGYDSRLEVGAHLGKLLRDDYASNIVVHNCSDDGCRVMLQAANDTVGGSLYINDYSRTNFADFLALWPRASGIVSITGCSYVAAPTAAGGSRPKFSFNNSASGNDHNFFRGAGDRIYICSNDIATKHGWNQTYRADNNPPIRLGRNDPGSMRAIIARNVIEGAIENQLDNAQGTWEPRHILVEGNYLIVNPTYTIGVRTVTGLMTVRNNIILKHSTPKIAGSGTGWRSPLEVDSYRPPANGLDEPIFFYGNSLIDLSNDATIENGGAFVTNSDAGGDGLFNHVEVANNIRHAPNVSGGPSADLDTTPLAWDARYNGLILNFVMLSSTFTSSTAPSGVYTVPYAGNILDSGGNQLGPSDLSGAGAFPFRHVLDFDKTYSEAGGDFAANYDGVGQTITVTNTSGYAWAQDANVRIFLNSGNRIVMNLASDVAVGETLVFNNPNGYTAHPTDTTILYQRDMDGSQFGLSIAAAGVELRNLNAVEDWPAGAEIRLIIDTGTNQLPVNTDYAHPAGTVSLYRPNAAVTADVDLLPLHDLTGFPRVGSNHPAAVPGTPSKGATNPV